LDLAGAEGYQKRRFFQEPVAGAVYTLAGVDHQAKPTVTGKVIFQMKRIMS